ncbi:MBL fold metallo-hydrolase [Kocuria sp. M1R5S2]|uniref:MBL fold metallo-hydrolase n=1 Tax=Kocuria rhizosphaerae TaxID=3376285 RepID=UPI00379EB4D0
MLSATLRQPAPARPRVSRGMRVERVAASGVRSRGGDLWGVESNVWIVGDDERCVVIDPAHDPAAVLAAVGGRAVAAVLLTHGDDDQVRVLRELAEPVGAPVYLHPADTVLSEQAHPVTRLGRAISDGDTFVLGGVRLTALHTPGYSPGSVCFSAPGLGDHGVLFSGETLLRGGVGATGRSCSDRDAVVESVRTRLLTLPEDTEVLAGHGEPTTVGNEKPLLHDWIDRGR